MYIYIYVYITKAGRIFFICLPKHFPTVCHDPFGRHDVFMCVT